MTLLYYDSFQYIFTYNVVYSIQYTVAEGEGDYAYMHLHANLHSLYIHTDRKWDLSHRRIMNQLSIHRQYTITRQKRIVLTLVLTLSPSLICLLGHTYLYCIRVPLLYTRHIFFCPTNDYSFRVNTSKRKRAKGGDYKSYMRVYDT